MFLANEILNDTMISKRPNEAINWDLPPQNTNAPRPALSDKIKIKSSLPELNFLSHFKWSRVRTPLVVTILVGLTIVMLLVGKGISKDTPTESIEQVAEDVVSKDEKITKTLKINELKIATDRFSIDELILQGAMGSNFTTPELPLCEKSKCEYDIKVSNKENKLLFTITVEKKQITKVVYNG